MTLDSFSNHPRLSKWVEGDYYCLEYRSTDYKVFLKKEIRSYGKDGVICIKKMPVGADSFLLYDEVYSLFNEAEAAEAFKSLCGSDHGLTCRFPVPERASA